MKKREYGGHHHTAWKVAYADFVTAMMAFFLLLWLYSTMDSTQKNNIADYFTPTVGTPGSAGIGVKGGLDEQSLQGIHLADLGKDGIVKAQLAQGSVAMMPTDTVQINKEALDISLSKTSLGNLNEFAGMDEVFMAVSEALQQLRSDDENSFPSNNIMLDRVRDTMRITVIDDPKSPIFKPGGGTLTPRGAKQLASFARIIAVTRRNITIGSHTATLEAIINRNYTGWELSADYGKAVNRILREQEVSSNCIMEMASYADSKPFTPSEPANPRNNRITITLLNSICDTDG